jgi:hypothetical protein
MTDWKVGLDWMADKALYDEYLRRLDARAVLDRYGAQNCREQLNRDGTTEIVHSCLLDRVERHHANGDAHPSAALNVDKKVYVCYSGGWSGDLFHLVMKLEGKEAFADVLPEVGKFLTGATSDTETIRADLDRIFTGPDAYALNLPAYADTVLDAFDKSHPYWASRGITPEVQKLLRLGYDEREHRIVFPHFVCGTLVGWQKRVIPGETVPDFPKYRSSPGLPKAETLYGHDLAMPDGKPRDGGVIVVESPMSVAKGYSIGLLPGSVVATFGAKVTEGQIALLREHSKVIVWFDADPAGMAGERRLLEALHRHTETFRVTPTKGKDMADLADLDDFARYTMFHTMPGSIRLGEIDHARRFGYG